MLMNNNKTKNIVYFAESLNKSVNVVTRFYNIGRQDSENGYYYKPHIQEEYEIIYMLSGTLHYKINGNEFTATSGDSYLIQPGQQHEEFADDGFISFYYIKCNFYKNNGELVVLTDDYAKQRIPNCGKEIKNIFEKVFNEVHAKLLGYWQVAESLVVELLCLYLRKINPSIADDVSYEFGANDKKPNYGNRIVNDAVDIMKNQGIDVLSVEEIAKAVSVSPSYLHALFKTYLNVSPVKFMTQLKIDQAKRMLLQTDAPIKSVANYFGFTSASHFTKVFKRITGVSPFDYRKQFKKM